MHKPQQQVKEFHVACDLPAPETLYVDWDDVRGVRQSLITEEVDELCAAAAEENIVEYIDALCDILYVVYGAAVSMGIDLEPFFDEVQRSNMQKTTGPKREDGKQLKPEGWQPPNIMAILSDLLLQEDNQDCLQED